MNTTQNSTQDHHRGSSGIVDLKLKISKQILPAFFQFLGQGFRIETLTGCSLEEIICQQLDIDPDYFQNRVETIFLNGKPVDDPASASVADGSRITLSAAMPGLAGAMMRKGGILSSMRSTISHNEDETSTCAAGGTITLKLFNLIGRELGPKFLQKGILIDGDDLNDFLTRQGKIFWEGIKSATVDDRNMLIEQVKDLNWSGKEILLQISVDGDLNKGMDSVL
jgi:hypothetical protein